MPCGSGFAPLARLFSGATPSWLRPFFIGLHASVRRRVAALARYGRRSAASFPKLPQIALGPRTDPTDSTATRIHRLPTTTHTPDSRRSVATLQPSMAFACHWHPCHRAVSGVGIRADVPCGLSSRGYVSILAAWLVRLDVAFGSPPLPIRWDE